MNRVIRIERGERLHAVLGASSAKRWRACPGSVRLIESLTTPDRSSPFAAEGTACHAVIEKALTEDKAVHEFIGWRVQWQEGDNGYDFEVTDEMVAAAGVFTQHVRSLPATERHYELRVDLGPVSAPAGVKRAMFGTVDYAGYDRRTGIVDIADYKHGKGVLVPIQDNDQLRYYAIGTILALGHKPVATRLTIIQPRCTRKFHPAIRTEVLSWEQLHQYRLALMESARRAESPDAPFQMGEHCRFCPAKRICPAQQEALQDEARSVFG